MNSISHKNQSFWSFSGILPKGKSLKKKLQADVCIVGAGISGMTTAYTLMQEGKSVIIVDKAQVASGETSLTTAHLSNALDDGYLRLEKLFGVEGARLAAQSHARAIDFIEETVQKEKIACDFERVDGYLFLGPGQKLELLDQELEAAHRAGLTGVIKISDLRVNDLHFGPALKFPHQGQFHPLKYLLGLYKILKKNGVQVYTQTKIVKIEEYDQYVELETEDGYSIQAQACVVATNSPFIDRWSIHSKQAAYTTYAIGVGIPKNSFKKALYWDTMDPYHYVRCYEFADSPYDILIIGGEDYKTGQFEENPESKFHKLYDWAKIYFPFIYDIEFQWSGQVMEPIDSLAFIGLNPQNKRIYIVTGDSGHGMTHGTIAGMLLKDLIVGKNNPWTELYNPSRKNIKAAGEFFAENVNTLAHYAEIFKPAEATSVENISAQSGAIVQQGDKKLAIYRDKNGHLRRLSPICPHLGCIVHWNDFQKSWDCPCHGSRFTPLGKVIHGPANINLSQED